jgi:hypothetical protein
MSQYRSLPARSNPRCHCAAGNGRAQSGEKGNIWGNAASLSCRSQDPRADICAYRGYNIDGLYLKGLPVDFSAGGLFKVPKGPK